MFRVDENGEILQIAGSEFAFGDYYIYDDGLFKEWVSTMEYYLENRNVDTKQNRIETGGIFR